MFCVRTLQRGISTHSRRLFTSQVTPQHHRRSFRTFLNRRRKFVRKALAFSGFSLSCYALHKEAQMCGIVGYVGDQPALDYLLEGLLILQNRGYDSAGISTVRTKGKDAELIVTKYASLQSTSDSIKILQDKAPSNHEDDGCGIAHTRWATHGAKTDENAHPHTDYKNRIALVHNGTIINSHELKDELQKLGITFTSETDTEVIAQMIGRYMDEGMAVLDALEKTLERLEGTYGLAVIDKCEPGQILAVRNGSPLMVGIGENKMWVASEHSAFARHTRDFIALKDGEVAIINASGVQLDDYSERLSQAPHEEIELSPAPYPHWTIKEIFDQPAAISRSLKYGARLKDDDAVMLGGLDERKDLLLNIKHLLIGACGTSFYAGQYGAKLMRYLHAFDTVQAIDSAEIEDETLPQVDGGLLVVSQSGETKDVHRNLVMAQSHNMPIFSVINSIGSLIARTTQCGVYVHAGREHAVASTKAFVTQVTCLSLIAGWFSQNRLQNNNVVHNVHNQRREYLIESLHHLPTYTGMTLHTQDQCKNIAERIKDKEHIFVLGKGFGEPIAMEGALKIKEITYIHAEGYSGGALKHGPFALIEQGTPIVMLVLDDKHAPFMQTAVEEVKARGAHTIAITDNPKLVEGIAHEVIKIPSNGPLTALLAVIPMQLLAYELAIRRGIDPDKPKNLAKAVTVD